MAIEISQDAICRVAQSFEERTFERGLRYAREGRVHLVRAEAWPVVAQVRGTEGYVVTVHYTPESDHMWGECSCPVYHSCKHAVATALVAMSGALEEMEDLETLRRESRVGDWLRRLGESAESEPRATPADKRRELIYTLQERHGRLVLLLQQCTRLRSGKLGKASGILFGGYRSSTIPSWMKDQDRRLVHRLWIDAGVDEGLNPVELRHLGVETLEALCESDRFFYGSHSSLPLRLGEIRREALQWREHPSGEGLRLGLADHLLLLSCAEPMYLDVEEGILGPLDLGLSSSLVFGLHSGPPVPEHMIETVERSLHSLAPESEVELSGRRAAIPHSVEPEPALPMVPHVDIRLGEDPYEPTMRQLLIECSARYGEELYPLGQWVPSRPGVRDLVAEGKAAREFESLMGARPLGSARSAQELRDEARVAAHKLVPALVERGWSFELDVDFPVEAPLMQVEFIESLRPVGQSNFFFDYELGVMVNGREVKLLPLLLDAIRKGLLDLDRNALVQQEPRGINLELPTGELVHIGAARIARWLRPLLELRLGELSDEHSLRVVAPVAAGLLEQEADVHMSLEDRKRLNKGMAPLLELAPRSAGKDFDGELREYQALGHAWLRFHHEQGSGGVLADDMGLGKTVQLLAFLDGLRAARKLSKKRPALVVAPRSVVGNWAQEAERFCPKLSTLVHLGSSRAREAHELLDTHLILTSYQTLLRDKELFAELELGSLVLDESQAIKNPDTKLRRACASLSAQSRFCVTGTPMENHLGELWSQFDLVLPGLLGTRSNFRTLRTAIEKNGMDEVLELLQRRLRPFMLRRSKSEVAIELPPKTIIVEKVPLDAGQRDLYESVRLAVDRQVQKALEDRGVTGSGLAILEALLRLRQVCCDPRLVKGREAKKVPHSAKLQRLLAMLEELADNGRRVLVFSQFTSMLALVEEELRAVGMPFVTLTGSTRDREQVIRRFQEGEVPVFLISLKAGGVGLNLTQADTVIHYDPWWNPAVEAQATDRAHRIGQDKPVHVYKLVAEGTLEERICTLQEEKSALSQAALSRGGVRHLGAEDLASLYEQLC